MGKDNVVLPAPRRDLTPFHLEIISRSLCFDQVELLIIQLFNAHQMGDEERYEHWLDKINDLIRSALFSYDDAFESWDNSKSDLLYLKSVIQDVLKSCRKYDGQIDKLKTRHKEKQEAIFSRARELCISWIQTIDNRIEFLEEGENIGSKDVPVINGENYSVGQCTPFIDADFVEHLKQVFIPYVREQDRQQALQLLYGHNITRPIVYNGSASEAISHFCWAFHREKGQKKVVHLSMNQLIAWIIKNIKVQKSTGINSISESTAKQYMRTTNIPSHYNFLAKNVK